MEEILTIHNTVTHRTKGKYYKDVLKDDNRIRNIGVNDYISFCFKTHESIDNLIIDNSILNNDPETERGIYVIVHGNDIYWETDENWKEIVKSNYKELNGTRE